MGERGERFWGGLNPNLTLNLNPTPQGESKIKITIKIKKKSYRNSAISTVTVIMLSSVE